MSAVAPTIPGNGGSQPFAGLRALLRFTLRRDRIRLPVWILGLTSAIAATAASYPGIYATAEERHGALLTISNPGTTALVGAVYGEGDYTYGIMAGHQLLAMTTVVAALMSIFTVVRHTRAEEESGRAELVRSSVVGRHASATTAVLVVLGANVALALALALSLGALGIETVTWAGSFLYGAATAGVGLVFAGIAAITVQLTESARSASSLAGLTLAAAYALRGVGDVAENGLSWASPIGWAQATETYYRNNWAPVILLILTAAVWVAFAAPLSKRRDVGAGLSGTRPGPARAGAGLRGAFGLAWRLNRAGMLGWAVALFIFGLAYGPVLSEADSFLKDLPIMAEFLPELDAGGAALFGSLVIAIAAIVCAVPTTQVRLRLRAEETAGRASPLLATLVSRPGWALRSAALAVLTAALTLTLFGIGMGLGAGLSMSQMSWVGNSLVASLNYLPAILVVAGLALFFVGFFPRAAGTAWVAVVYAVFVMYFGGLLDLPQWAMNISPFNHVPQLPAADFNPVPLVWLTLIASALGGAGVLGLRRRDIEA